MTLYDMRIGDCGVVIELSGGKAFRNRLTSFGITRDCKFTLKALTMMRNVFSIELNNGTSVALRRGESKKIMIELCNR